MPARLSLTKAQRDALLVLPDTEEAFVRHYTLSAEDVEIVGRYRTPETRLAFALQLCERAAEAAGINTAVSPHWLRHAHGSHAIERGASLPEVQATLGHGNIATTHGRTAQAACA